jgi:hypothetical protein
MFVVVGRVLKQHHAVKAHREDIGQRFCDIPNSSAEQDCGGVGGYVGQIGNSDVASPVRVPITFFLGFDQLLESMRALLAHHLHPSVQNSNLFSSFFFLFF